MRKALILTVMIMLPLAGCGSVFTKKDNSVPETTVTEAAGNQALTPESAEKNIPITLTVGETVITATLNNSKTSQDFIKTLPRTMNMSRWGDREYYGKVQNALSTEGNSQNGFANGDVAYWPPGGSFALFFDKANPNTPSPLIIMGKITSDLKAFDQLGEAVEMKIKVK